MQQTSVILAAALLFLTIILIYKIYSKNIQQIY